MGQDLYTSEVHLKRLLAGQATPAFTAPPHQTLQVLDPAFFPGMGALNEDAEGRIQCPMRGCGTWHRMLAGHLHQAHKSIGGIAAIRGALGIPKSVPLVSRKFRAARHTPPAAGNRAHITAQSTHAAALRWANPATSRISASQRNWADSCPAQLQERICLLERKLGHAPSYGEFEQEFGTGTARSVITLFGTWNAAKAMAGVECYPSSAGGIPSVLRERRLTYVVESLRAWVGVHGDLPSSTAAQHNRDALVPMLPKYATILKAFDVNNWQAAMRSAVEHLGIRSERYSTMRRTA